MDVVINDFLNQQYSQAYVNVEKILQSDPDNIDALFMRLNALQIEIIDYESYALKGYKFIKSVDSVLVFFDTFIHPANTKEQAKFLFYKGTIHGMKALVLAKIGEWMPKLILITYWSHLGLVGSRSGIRGISGVRWNMKSTKEMVSPPPLARLSLIPLSLKNGATTRCHSIEKSRKVQ